jgi:hypothetical protein
MLTKTIKLSEQIFELIEGSVFVFDLGIKEASLSVQYYWKEKSQKNKRLHFINHPKDSRYNLVSYDTMSQAHQDKIKNRFGDPYEFMAKQPIRQLVQEDAVAEKFYMDHRYADNKYLPIEHRNRYTTAASWLNMLIAVNEDKKYIKKELKLSLDQFWVATTDIIKTDKIELPHSTRRLLAKMKEYKKQKYACLIDWRFGNKNTAKLGKGEEGFDDALYQKQISFVRKAASMPNNFDAAQIAMGVNAVFEKQGWPTISSATVYNIINANRHLTLAGSRGKRAYNNEISMQTKRSRPEYPLYYLTLDGWTVELLYQEDSKYHHRLCLVVVLDVMNNYPIGYAIGDREDTNLIRQANRNASEHIKELFGDYYQPHQLQSDNYGIKNLTPFYKAMAHLHTPAAVGNAKAKVIEPYFNSINKKYCQTQPNWSGFNLTSKKSNQPNTEFLDKIKHSLPTKAGVIHQIECMMAEERRTKLPAYLAAWDNTPADRKVLMNKMDMLHVHGKESKHLNSIDGMGLTATIGGNKITYDSFDPAFRALQHLPWQVIYDQADLSEILVRNSAENRQFLLAQKRIIPMDVHSMTAADHQYRSQITDFNKQRREEVMQTYLQDDAAVAAVINGNAELENETALKLMFTYAGQQKESIQNAKGLKKVQELQEKAAQKEEQHEAINWQQQQQDYLNSKIDFDKYKD